MSKRTVGRVGGRLLALATSLLSSACGPRRQPGPPNPNPGSTLELTPQHAEPESAGASLRARVVASGQITQPWHVGYFSPATVTVPDVRAGDALIAVGIYWGDLPRHSEPRPVDSHGVLVAAVDQGPTVLGYVKPPVFAQIHVELDAAPGRHVITPPELGGPAGDGTFYVLQVRGLEQKTGPVATGQTRATGTALGDVSVSLGGDVAAGDFLVAIGGYDNTTPRPRADLTHPPVGWVAVGVQEDASNNVPSEVCHRVSAEAGRPRVTWAWTDPHVNVACAAMAAFR